VTTLPVAAQGYAILATAPAVCGNGLQLSGSQIDITGNIRSNGNINISGSQIEVHGAISYGGSGHVGTGVNADSVTHSPLPVVAVVPWLLTDFLPGARWSSLPGYTAHLGSWTISGGGATPGIHYVAGDVTISGNAPALTGVTIVATGRIQVSGAATISPARSDMPALFSAGGSCWNSGINLSGSKIEWSGVIAAPNGLVQVSSSKVDGGRIIGGAVQMSGSDIELH
jgi:formylmethanofuran dehydrogenase subunit C